MIVSKLQQGLEIIGFVTSTYKPYTPELSINTEDLEELMIILDDCEKYSEEQIKETIKEIEDIFNPTLKGQRLGFKYLESLGFKFFHGLDENYDDLYLIGFKFNLR